MDRDAICAAGTRTAPKSGLPGPREIPDPFVALDRVDEVDETRLAASASFCGEAWRLLEAAAQAACMHLRILTDFSWPVVLLGVGEADLDGDVRGPVRVEAELLGRSTEAARYRVRLLGAAPEGDVGSATVTVGRGACADAGQAARLSAHWREVFECIGRKP